MSETASVSLNITDIADLIKIVDYCAEQGAIKGWSNIRQCLAIRDRVDQFVTQAANAVEQQKSEEIEPSPDDLPPPRVSHKNHQV